MSYLFANLEDRFSRDEARIYPTQHRNRIGSWLLVVPTFAFAIAVLDGDVVSRLLSYVIWVPTVFLIAPSKNRVIPLRTYGQP